MKMRIGAAALGVMMAAGTAQAQNVGNNAGIWWNPAPGQPSAFTFLNPLTTMYGRIGGHHAFTEDGTLGALGGANPLPAGVALRVPDQWGMHLGLGFRVMPVLRYEMQLGGQFNSSATATNLGVQVAAIGLASAQWLNNVYLDLAPLFGNSLWGLNPYVMAGIGVSRNVTRSVTISGVPDLAAPASTTAFAWNAGAGVQWQVMRHAMVDVAYRYLDAGSYRINPTGFIAGARIPNRSHQIMFSIVVPVDGLIRGFGN